jgi:hypothetical protein
LGVGRHGIGGFLIEDFLIVNYRIGAAIVPQKGTEVEQGFNVLPELPECA